MKGVMTQESGPLTAAELAEALLEMADKFGDKPVQMAAWMAKNEDDNDSASYVQPYDKDGNDSRDPAYFYIHGCPVEIPG